jgi:trigger factor
MDQYLKMVRKSREEYLEEVRPQAERRVKRQLVLDAVAQSENITVEPEELEALLKAYAQLGQALPHTEDRLRALAFSYRREKALSHLVEMTTDPDPEEEENEASIVDAQAGSLTEEEGKTEASTADEQPPTALPTDASDSNTQVMVASAQTSTASPTNETGKGGEGSVEIETRLKRD